MTPDRIIRDQAGRPMLAVYGWQGDAPPPSGPQLVPFTRDNLRPAMDRMARAEDAVIHWRRKGKRPHVVWDPCVEVQDADGNVLDHPVGCLPEVIHTLNQYAQQGTNATGGPA